MEREAVRAAKRVVIKIGSRVLTGEGSGVDEGTIRRICREVAELRREGREVIIVSSGAIAAGRGILGMEERPRTIPQKQAAAAIGQSRLIRSYEEAFAEHGVKVAQILLTAEDLSHRMRFLNARATLETLLSFRVAPVINENDTVAVEEIKFGDNDNLSALVASLADADLLVILTDIDGFYDRDPRESPQARLLPLVRRIDREIESAAGGAGSAVGTGGMATKVAAARKAGLSGIPTLIVNGGVTGNLAAAFAGQSVGTLFLPPRKRLSSRKHWIAYTIRPKGKLTVDAGAGSVLTRQGRSLLSSGIIAVEGNFQRGDCVRICDGDGALLGKGIVDYSRGEIEKVLGRHSSEIESILGYRYGDEIIHRNNMVILQEASHVHG